LIDGDGTPRNRRASAAGLRRVFRDMNADCCRPAAARRGDRLDPRSVALCAPRASGCSRYGEGDIPAGAPDCLSGRRDLVAARRRLLDDADLLVGDDDGALPLAGLNVRRDRERERCRPLPLGGGQRDPVAVGVRGPCTLSRGADDKRAGSAGCRHLRRIVGDAHAALGGRGTDAGAR